MIYPQNMAAALRRFEPAATPVELPDDGESGGDLSPDDDTDCAPEGLSCEAWHAQYEGTEAVDDDADAPLSDYLVATVAGLIARVRRLEAGANDANNRFQTYECRIAELERQIRRSRDEQAAALALEVRALDAAREVA